MHRVGLVLGTVWKILVPWLPTTLSLGFVGGLTVITSRIRRRRPRIMLCKVLIGLQKEFSLVMLRLLVTATRISDTHPWP